MTLEAFHKGTQRLAALPPEEVKRALVIAQDLNGDDREELLRQLKEMNRAIEDTYEEEAKSLIELDHLEGDLSKAVKEFEVSANHLGQLRASEQTLTTNS